MRLKYVLPANPIPIWQEQLQQVNEERSKLAIHKMKVAQDMMVLRARERAGQAVGSEISACHRVELHVRMAELAADRQKNALEAAISQ